MLTVVAAAIALHRHGYIIILRGRYIGWQNSRVCEDEFSWTLESEYSSLIGNTRLSANDLCIIGTEQLLAKSKPNRR